MTELTPGANAPLPSGDLTVLIRHGAIAGAEIDVSAFLVTRTGKVRSDADMCFYGQPSVAGGAVALAGASGGETRFTVAPGRIPAGVEKVVFTATIHENRAPFGRLPEISLEVNGVRGRIPCAGMTETALILAELYQRNGAWKVRIVGQGFNGGLAALATHLGVEISDPGPAPAPSEPVRTTARAEPVVERGLFRCARGRHCHLKRREVRGSHGSSWGWAGTRPTIVKMRTARSISTRASSYLTGMVRR